MIKKHLIGDFWGGLSAMLVALPSAIAFGVTAYAPLGGYYGTFGAIAGILGVIILGIVNPIFGGTKRLISAPCAPATAVLSAFVLEQLAHKFHPETIFIMMTIVGLLAGGFQLAFGLLRTGTLIKFIPYPVVSGYLSGVGLYIIVSQLAKFFGAPKGTHFFELLSNPELWRWQSLVVGGVTVVGMLVGPRFVKKIPGVIFALVLGIVSYFILAFFDRSLLTTEGNSLIIGKLSSGIQQIADSSSRRINAINDFSFSNVLLLLIPSLTLAVLLSIDTLKTCVVLDALTHSRHNSNKELMGQGWGNISVACIGGMPGAGTMGATLVNISSGAKTSYSAIIAGILALLTFLVLSFLIAWIPIASLAAILIVVGIKMIDKHSFSYLKKRSTILDFVVITLVVITALSVSLIAASGVGIVVAIFLYLREQIKTSVLHMKSYGNDTFSKQIRVQEEVELLQEYGKDLVIYELQGSLFFGTSNQLNDIVESDIKTKKFFIFDMKRVQSIDLTAVHSLELISKQIKENNGIVMLSRVPERLPNGQNIDSYLREVGFVSEKNSIPFFDDLDLAIEWVESQIIKQQKIKQTDTRPLNLEEFELFKGRSEKTILELVQSLEMRTVESQEFVFNTSDKGDEIFFIRQGSVRIELSTGENDKMYHVGTFGQGNFFGEIGFLLESTQRTANAIATTRTELFVLSRVVFEKFISNHKKAGIQFLEGLASVLASRLRVANMEIRALDA